ncbi:uncharacterized protein LOC133187318 [Saccostrea echinata]|uniref:uncharacterized protein LOC133187318 n=1 Tax=Saccostrea echinata TaxID=191078 RepID=UPI002A841C43|nr:uncharacterized protein LOC133187318 [Saccostrea echinata]
MEGHWSSVLYTVLLSLSVYMMKCVLSDCPVSSSGTCLIPVSRLQHYVSDILPLGGFYTTYNKTVLVDICRLVGEYPTCSQTITKGCDRITTQNMHLLYRAFLPLCGKYKQDYVYHRDCYSRQMFMYKSCHQRRQDEIHQIRREEHYNLQICQITNQYMKCVYLVTALQCSMEAADAYFNILNQSISLSFRDADFTCHIRHPDDDISVFTTTKSTTRAATSLGFTTSVGGPKGKRSVSSEAEKFSANLGCFLLLRVVHFIILTMIL